MVRMRALQQHSRPALTTTNMSYKLLLLAALLVLAASMPQEDYPPPKYDFQWEVNDAESENYYSQQESRDDALTNGRYEVVLPDGKKQIVVYSVEGDEGGFQAEVTYE